MAWSWCIIAALISDVVGDNVHLVAERSPDVELEVRQQAGVVSSAAFLRRAYHGSVVAGNYVYIDGGAFSYSSAGVPSFDYSTTTLSIDLSTSWTNSTVTINSNSKPVGVPNLDDGSLWYDAKNNALIAGFSGAAPRFNTPAPYPIGLWTYALDNQGGGAWSAASTQTTALQNDFTRPYQGLSAWGSESAFTIGGYISALTSPATTNLTGFHPVSGITSYNMTTGTFQNSSAAGYNINGTAERGVLHYIPSFGPEGLYIVLGGDTSGLGLYTAGENLHSFANLTLYDPSTGTFYNQTATGNIPEPRIEFCATGANSSNGTYEIFLYAGWGSHLGAVAIPYDEIYILTLPAFEWIKVNYPPANPRHGHTCHTVGGSNGRQMLVIGGVDTTQSTTSADAPTLDKATFTTQDPFTQGLAIFDMVDLKWADGYNASKGGYMWSDSVAEYYGSHSMEPSSWGSTDLQALFSMTHFTNTNKSSSSNTTTPSNNSSSSSSSSNTGAIAGGIAGGLAGLALLAGLTWFLYRRHQRWKSLPSNPEMAHKLGTEGDNTNEYLGAYGSGHGSGYPTAGPGTGIGGHPVSDYKYAPVPAPSEVAGDERTMAHQMPTPSDHDDASPGTVHSELEGGRARYELA